MLKHSGAEFWSCVDLTGLPLRKTRGYRRAVLVAFSLSPAYIHRIRKSAQTDYTEFLEKEKQADRLAEMLAFYLTNKGYLSYAQSEYNLGLHKEFDEKTKRSPLPHKTIAIMAGIGWIGKDNLLVTKKYGSALCMCTVLTNAPLPVNNKPMMQQGCGSCTVCMEACPKAAITGRSWSRKTDRDQLLVIDRCECCLKCLANCPWTVAYAKDKVIPIRGRLNG